MYKFQISVIKCYFYLLINAVLNVKRFVDNENLVSSFLKEPMDETSSSIRKAETAFTSVLLASSTTLRLW